MKLIKESEHQGLSWCVVDVVFYKDEDGKRYRLQYVLPDDISKIPEEGDWLRVMYVSNYAPDIIEGDVIKESKNEIRIKYKEDTYFFQKNAENFRFIDVSKNLREITERPRQ